MLKNKVFLMSTAASFLAIKLLATGTVCNYKSTQMNPFDI